MDIQTEVQKIHHQFGVSEKANYEIQKIFDKAIKEAVTKALRIHDVMQCNLESKEAQYKEVCAWFKNEYDSSSDKDEVAEWEKNGTEFNAQIKLLRHLISECS